MCRRVLINARLPRLKTSRNHQSRAFYEADGRSLFLTDLPQRRINFFASSETTGRLRHRDVGGNMRARSSGEGVSASARSSRFDCELTGWRIIKRDLPRRARIPKGRKILSRILIKSRVTSSRYESIYQCQPWHYISPFFRLKYSCKQRPNGVGCKVRLLKVEFYFSILSISIRSFGSSSNVSAWTCSSCLPSPNLENRNLPRKERLHVVNGREAMSKSQKSVEELPR